MMSPPRVHNGENCQFSKRFLIKIRIVSQFFQITLLPLAQKLKVLLISKFFQNFLLHYSYSDQLKIIRKYSNEWKKQEILKFSTF